MCENQQVLSEIKAEFKDDDWSLVEKLLSIFHKQNYEGDIKAPQQRGNLEEIFGDVESCGSFSSESEEEKQEKADLKNFSVQMPLSFESEDKYIEKMIEMMKLNNRDPLGRKLH